MFDNNSTCNNSQCFDSNGSISRTSSHFNGTHNSSHKTVNQKSNSIITNQQHNQGNNNQIIVATSASIGATAAVAGVGIALYKSKYCFGTNRISALVKRCCCDTSKAEARMKNKNKAKKEEQLDKVEKELDKV